MKWKTELTELSKRSIHRSEYSLRFNEPLGKHTYFGIGGNADAYFEVATVAELSALIDLKMRHSIPMAILGRGSNLLVSDEGFRGVVIRLVGHFNKLEFNGEKVSVSAGVSLPKLSKIASEHALSGLEFALGIPGSVGGAAIMNAGAWGSSFSELVDRVQVMGEDGSLLELSKDEAKFSYRNSDLGKYFCVTGTLLNLTKSEVDRVTKQMNELYRKKMLTQPFAEENTGCIFKNPNGNSAGKLIDRCGLKGAKIGKAMVSKLHANFIINLGGATAKNVLELIDKIQWEVAEKTGIKLETEVKMLGYEK